MSIQGEINDLRGNVADMLSAVEEYGVNTTGANSDDMSGLVRAIPKATIVQGPGESESQVMSQKAVTDLVADALGDSGNTEYETVDSVEEMTDTSKQYVLSSTGTLWAYTENTVNVEHNAYDPATAKLNYRINSSGSEAVLNGALLLPYEEVEYATYYPITIKGIERLQLNYSSYFVVDHYNSAKTKIGQYASNEFGINQSNWDGVLPKTFNLFGPEGLENTKYVRIKFGIKPDGTAISASDVAGLVVNFEPKNSTKTESAWYDTGLPASVAGDGGNYVTLLAKVEKNKTDISEVSRRVTTLETVSETLTIPTFWQSAVDACISKIKALQVGRNCITFAFVSDSHQRNGYTGMLIAHVMKECHIPYCIYGGDSIDSGYIASEAVMIEQDKAFDAIMSYVPNGRLCRAVGNHDGYWYDGTNKFYYTREQVYELFLREESVAQNKHFGDDGTYYYVDDIASKTRFIVLNTSGGSFDAVQLAWMQDTALVFDAPGWAVVFISHQPISNHYHSLISNAADVRAAVKNYMDGSAANKADVVGWFSGHIHRDRMYAGAAVNTEDDSEGDAMGFTQVTITSDHTGIAYDDATKHPVAADDQSHAIDFVTINKATRIVNLTRLGIGMDRRFGF